MQMRFVARRKYKRRSLDLDEIPRREKLPQGRCNKHACQQEWAPASVQNPEWRSHPHAPSADMSAAQRLRKLLANGPKISMVARNWWLASGNRGTRAVKVIASSLRKGNIVEVDGKLYVVLNAESFHPGKGTPTTQIDMRRISDGVKVAQRFKTTEQVERAYVEDRDYQYLYQDSDGFHFMNTETYDQVTLPADVIGNQAAYLQPEMKVMLSVHEGVPVAIELPQKATLEVVETEPSVKGQTAASSYKPALLSNGVRTMVPPFVGPGTKIVVMTADGSYVERAKD
jgi:elongation factor P